jgi:hypothetical protein
MMKHVDEVFKTEDIPSIEILSHYMKEFIMKSENFIQIPKRVPTSKGKLSSLEFLSFSF